MTGTGAAAPEGTTERAVRRTVSMSDVALAAGVSMQTVSRVANHSDSVAPATRERVLEVMSTLGYRPNTAARALKSGRFRSIGVLMYTLQTLGNIRTLDAISSVAARQGYGIDLITVQDPSTGGLGSALTRLGEEAVDGIILVLERHEAVERAIRFPAHVPVIIVDSEARPDRASVNADQFQGAELATRHLLELGHPTVWHVAGPASSNAARLRELRWREVLVEAGRAVPEVQRGDWSAASGYRAGVELMKRDDVTAVFTANDQMALGLLRAAHEVGRRVPAELSVVGFDDGPESADFWPPLTTVHQDFGAAGDQAVELLFQALDGGGVAPGVRTIPTTLIVRRSTGPYRG